MKKIFTFCLLFIIGLSFSLEAQNPKRYILMQHFTNTLCSVCSTKNPPFFEKIADYPNDIHHFSIHPPVPYSSCEFYLEDIIANEYFANLVGINGTPKLFVWGESVSTSSLLPDAVLQSSLGQTSPVHVAVVESGTTSRMVDVTITAYEDIPNLNDYRLFAVAVEKDVNYDAPNGEPLHHNVMRTMLVPEGGITMQSMNAGETFSFQASYEISPNWVEGEMYTIAFLQNITTGDVLNSGTRFDDIVNRTKEKISTADVTIYPNPTTNQLNIDVAGLTVEQVSIYDIEGKLISPAAINNLNTSVNVSNLQTGIYFVKILLPDGIAIQKITKL